MVSSYILRVVLFALRISGVHNSFGSVFTQGASSFRSNVKRALAPPVDRTTLKHPVSRSLRLVKVRYARACGCQISGSKYRRHRRHNLVQFGQLLHFFFKDLHHKTTSAARSMSAATLLPRHHDEFRSKEYWDTFFQNRTDAFEW